MQYSVDNKIIFANLLTLYWMLASEDISLVLDDDSDYRTNSNGNIFKHCL